jgi:hypothetical protein
LIASRNPEHDPENNFLSGQKIALYGSCLLKLQQTGFDSPNQQRWAGALRSHYDGCRSLDALNVAIGEARRREIEADRQAAAPERLVTQRGQ